MSLCTCPACGRVFTSLSGFDAHQERRFGEPVPVVCHDPAARGLVVDEQTGRWRFPADAGSRVYHAKMRASEDAAHVPGTPRPGEAS